MACCSWMPALLVFEPGPPKPVVLWRVGEMQCIRSCRFPDGSPNVGGHLQLFLGCRRCLQDLCRDQPCEILLLRSPEAFLQDVLAAPIIKSKQEKKKWNGMKRLLRKKKMCYVRGKSIAYGWLKVSNLTWEMLMSAWTSADLQSGIY